MKKRMFFVAEDPLQPGCAYAGCVDHPDYEYEETIAKWKDEGAIVRQVDGNTMQDMMNKWQRPNTSVSRER